MISRWTAEEHQLFLQGVLLYGREWKKMVPLIKTRTVVQIRTHAQKVFKKDFPTFTLKSKATSSMDANKGSENHGGNGQQEPDDDDDDNDSEGHLQISTKGRHVEEEDGDEDGTEYEQMEGYDNNNDDDDDDDDIQ